MVPEDTGEVLLVTHRWREMPQEGQKPENEILPL